MKDYNKAEKWTKCGKNFVLEIYHWQCENYNCESEKTRMENMWNVYVYVYPEHPYFEKCKKIKYSYEVTLPMHRGCTYFEPQYKKVNGRIKLTSYKIGSDYHHLYDDAYAFINNIEDNFGVRDDAERLFDYMEGLDTV